MTKLLQRGAFLGFILTTAFLLYGLVNGAGCRYDLSVENAEHQKTFVTCYRGKVVVLHSLLNEQNELVSKWQVMARQMKFGKQVIYIIHDRNRIDGGSTNNLTDRYNEIFSGYNVLFYHVERLGDRVFIFENFPENNVIEGQLEGEMDLFAMVMR